MAPLRTSLHLLIMLACILFTAGCTFPLAVENITANASPMPGEPVARYKVTLSQPDDNSKFFTMDSDMYNPGEVVEFYITNRGSATLGCSNNPPAFSVRYQSGTGTWITRIGDEKTASSESTSLKSGESTAVYRFITADWAPGRYRIVSDCGISREIIIRTNPARILTPVANVTVTGTKTP